MPLADRTLLDYIAAHPGAGREEIRRHVAPTSSGPTVWRALKRLTMDDRAYVEGLIGVYELNDVSLLREVFVDAYLASAENYRVLRADLESPDKAALAYRDFVRSAVRRSVLEWKMLRPDDVRAMAVEAGIPEADRQGVVDYIGKEIRGLHEGNVIRYRLRPEDLAGLSVS